jgi:PAS domain-containing protein
MNGPEAGTESVAGVPLLDRVDHLEARLRLALDAGELGTWWWDRTTEVIVWDPTMERLFGLETGTFDGTFDTWTSLLHPDEVGKVLAVVHDAVEHRCSYQLDHRVIRP